MEIRIKLSRELSFALTLSEDILGSVPDLSSLDLVAVDTKSAMVFVFWLLLATSSAIIEDYRTYRNESISFYEVASLSAGDPGRRVHRTEIPVNRRAAPIDRAPDLMIAVIEPLGVELDIVLASDIYSSNYKEFLIKTDGSMIRAREGLPTCM